MCWSHRRRRDRPFLDCLAELEAPIARLTSRGAGAIVVAGMSQGGLGAIVFGARRSGLAGVIALAANGAPERLVGLFPQISESMARARAMFAEGRGDERASFTDLKIRGPFSIETTPTIYLSFFDPAGPANMFDNISRLRAPLLWVAGTADNTPAPGLSAFASERESSSRNRRTGPRERGPSPLRQAGRAQAGAEECQREICG
jgi:pimeloyl-ACP methyl ester carboxylesterase